MVAHTDPSTHRAGDSLEFQDSQGHAEKSFLENQKKEEGEGRSGVQVLRNV